MRHALEDMSRFSFPICFLCDSDVFRNDSLISIAPMSAKDIPPLRVNPPRAPIFVQSDLSIDRKRGDSGIGSQRSGRPERKRREAQDRQACKMEGERHKKVEI